MDEDKVMNEIILKGVLRDIQPSHVVNNTNYYKANIIVPRECAKDDILELKFKQFSLGNLSNGDTVLLSGNIRSYSQKISDNKNKVNIYVFTYFDKPSIDDDTLINQFEVSGEVCKVEPLNKTNSGKDNYHFILRNRIYTESGKFLLNYLPCSVWGRLAKNCKLSVGDKVLIKGELHSRLYKKRLDSGDIEFRTAHELLVTNITNCIDNI